MPLGMQIRARSISPSVPSSRRRAFSSGMTFIQAEVAYMDCLLASLKKGSFNPYFEMLKEEGLVSGEETSMKVLIAALFVAIGFKDGRLVMSQHLNEITVQRMERSIPEFLKGRKQQAAVQLVKDYEKALSSLTQRVEKVGRRLNDFFESEVEL
mmetsp:Transcript_94906/g.211002  ORF Transcript_94906/g.211002 Transcript_94906/m.211002 type:complete len:154 (-) Transcript_94906:52-513(-)